MSMRTVTRDLLTLIVMISFGLVGLVSPAWAQTGDGDGDGVEDSVDLCPADDASLFDVDGDGCIDATANARHVEYWASGELPLTYVVHQDGAPILTDGSDFAAIQAGFDAWSAATGGRLSATFGGTTPDAAGNGLDGVNLVSFQDPTFASIYGSAVLAVGITTSFEAAGEFNGEPVRPGQILDADMLFNPLRSYSTDTGGTGRDLRSVATHEAGHLFGISHSAIETATMFPALPTGNDARTLESDDVNVAYMADPDPASLATATRLEGTLTSGATGLPVPGAAVFAIGVASGDTLACQYTLPDGSWSIVGLPVGDVNVFVHPLDGSAGIKGVVPGYVNALVEANAETLFLPEYWDLGESATDDGATASPLTLIGGATVVADIVTNVDVTPPAVAEQTPLAGASGVRVDSVILLRFDEPIDFDTAQTRFRLENSDEVGVGGSLVLLNDGATLIFNPSAELAYDTVYQLEIGAGLEDRFANQTTTAFTTSFSTQPEPTLAVSSIAPNRGIPGTVVAISGVGIDPGATVDVSGTTATLLSVSASQIIAEIPEGVSGDAQVTVTSGSESSAPLLFTVLDPAGLPAGQVFDSALLPGTPRDVAFLPDDDFVVVGTDAGLSVVTIANITAGFFGEVYTSTPVSGGLDRLVVSPDGRRVYGIAQSSGQLHVFEADDADIGSSSSLFGQLLDTIDLEASPLGIAVDTAGRRAYVSTSEGNVLVFDVLRQVVAGQPLESLTYNRQVGVIEAGVPLSGAIAVTPDGGTLVTATAAGTVLSFSTTGDYASQGTFSTSADPRRLVSDAVGARIYLSDAAGGVLPISLTGLGVLPEVVIAGASRGLALSPDGAALYAANPVSDAVDVVDLRETSATFRTVVEIIDSSPDPVAITTSATGQYFVVAQSGTQSVSIGARGFGPVVRAVTPPQVRPGDRIVVSGSGFPAFDPDGAATSIPTVYFNDQEVSSIRATTTAVEVEVPLNFTGGTLRVRQRGGAVAPGLPEEPFSNAVPLPLLEPNEDGVGLRIAHELRTEFGYSWSPELLHNDVYVSPKGDLVGFFDIDFARIVWVDALPSSPTYMKELDSTGIIPFGPTHRVVFTADGNRAIYVGNGVLFPVIDTNRSSSTFGDILRNVDTSLIAPPEFALPDFYDAVAIPGGELLGIFDGANGTVFWVDLRAGESQFSVVDATSSVSGNGIAAHPSGRALYTGGGGGSLQIVDLDRFNALTYLTLLQGPTLDQAVRAIAADPGGELLYVLAQDTGAATDRLLYQFDVSDPLTPVQLRSDLLDSGTAFTGSAMVIAPQGDRMLIDTVIDQVYLRLPGANQAPFIESRPSFNLTEISPLGWDYSVDGKNLFVAPLQNTFPFVLDVAATEIYQITGGDEQTGVAGETLPLPVTVQLVRKDLSGAGDGTLLVEVLGGGTLPNGTALQIFRANDDGEIEFEWTLGPVPDADPSSPANLLRFSLAGGIPLPAVSAVSLPDPTTLPLSVVQVLPADGAVNVGINSSVQVRFSRAVDRSSVTASSISLTAQGAATPVTAAFGFADGDRRVTLTPLAPLEASTPYVLRVSTDVRDTDLGALTEADTVTFTSQAPPPLTLSSVSPPSGAVGASLVLAGTGFDPVPGNNTVYFNGLTVTPLSGTNSSLQVLVPQSAVTGTVSVSNGSETSSTLPFTVLVPSTAPVDEILQTVDSGITTQGIAITPDGTKAYAVSAETNQVLPLDLATLADLEPISVGNTPVSIVIDPDGDFAYVANFVSGTVSVIAVATDTVVETIPVGPNPFDILISPDGSDLYVLNTGDQTVSVVDTDAASATYRTVVTSFNTGSSTKGAAISPDGTILYVGTATGYLAISLEASSYGVTSSFTTGSSTKGAAITPDGTLLVLVTTDGQVLVVDVSTPGAGTVVTSFSTGSSTKGAAISPDGGLIYLWLEDSDEIVVVALVTSGTVSVVEADQGLAPITVTLEVIKTFFVGDDPAYLAFDPSGSGLALVSNEGDGNISVLNTSNVPVGQVQVDLEVTPRTLNLESNGRWITVRITPPAGIFAQNIEIASVLLQSELPPVAGRESLEDRDQDGILELVLKFDRARFQEIMPEGERVEVFLAGVVQPDDRSFAGRDTIRTLRPTITHPAGGEVLVQGAFTEITWVSPEGVSVSSIDVHWSTDDGETWQPLALGVPDAGRLPWTVPVTTVDLGRVLVTLYDDNGESIGASMSASTFAVSEPAVPVLLADVVADGVEGDGRLRWSVAELNDVQGFHILRATGEDASFVRLTEEPLAGLAKGTGGTEFEFLDTSVLGNTKYRYVIEEVRVGREGFQHGPFALEVRTVDRLDQNFPNGFNPRTTIRFSLQNEGRTRLVVYDVRGRRVNTLVDEQLKPDVYRVIWEGDDERGRSVASGVYLYRLETEGGFTATRKMTLVR